MSRHHSRLGWKLGKRSPKEARKKCWTGATDRGTSAVGWQAVLWRAVLMLRRKYSTYESISILIAYRRGDERHSGSLSQSRVSTFRQKRLNLAKHPLHHLSEEGILPVNSLPHVCRDVCNGSRSTEIRRKRATSEDCEEDTKWYFHNQGYNQRRQSRLDNP